MTYKEFLASKRFVLESSGFDIDKAELNPMLYEFQKDIVRWALKKGKACIFADCGLGKTPMQLSWAYQVHKHTGGKILILAPLAVAEQTRREAEKFGYDAKVVEEQAECIDGTICEPHERSIANCIKARYDGGISNLRSEGNMVIEKTWGNSREAY